MDFVQGCEKCFVDICSAAHVKGIWKEKLPRQPFPVIIAVGGPEGAVPAGTAGPPGCL